MIEPPFWDKILRKRKLPLVVDMLYFVSFVLVFKKGAQLSLIGGTMGLFSGFSIISGIEIVFFLFRLIEK